MSNTDFDPDAYLSAPNSSAAPTTGFDPDAYLAKPQPSLLESATTPITSIPSTYENMVHGAVEQMGRGVGQLKSGDPWEMTKGVGNLGLGALGYFGAPISAPIHTIVGKPIEDIVGSMAGPTAGKIAGTTAEIGTGFILPVPKVVPRELPRVPESPYGVTLSEGEKTGNLALRQKEQSEIRNADPHAQAWVEQRKAQMGTAFNNLLSSLDPYGTVIASTPQEAGELVSQGVQQASGARKAAVNQAYETARGLPGEIHSGVFEGMSQGIKGDLTLGDNPVIIDDKTTPFASKMIDDLDNRISQLKIVNKADPFGAPNSENITGVNLNGVDQMRKRLSAFRRDAFASGNAADGRAAQAVLDAFDKRIDSAVNSGNFTGDPSAVAAWNNARAAHADYRSTFGPTKNDPAARIVQKILGDKTNDPLTSTKVVDQIVGSSGTAPSSLNISVAKRIKNILGDNSPEWIAAQQGVLSRLIQTGEGESTLGTGQTAQRLSKFLNSDIAPIIYSPDQMATLRGYANLMRRITMPPGSFFPSAPPLQRAIALIGNRTGQIIGALIGRTLTPGVPLIGEFAGITVGGKLERALANAHGNVRSQLPILADQIQKWQKAQTLAQVRPNWATARTASAATLGLQRALAPLGIDLRGILQSPVPAAAQPPTAAQNQQP